MAKRKIETGTIPAPPEYKITITNHGPYLIYVQPPLAVQYIVASEMEVKREDEMA